MLLGMVYELGMIRTDRGLFVDKGNYAFDPRHMDFEGGAKGDGEHDDTNAIEAAIEAAIAAGGGIVHIPAGVYRVTRTITVTGNDLIIEGAKGAILDVNTSHSYTTPQTSPANLNSCVMLQILNSNRVEIRGLTFRQDMSLYDTETNAEWNHQIVVIGSNDVEIHHCRGLTPASDFVVIGRATHDTCQRVRCHHNYVDTPKRLSFAIINAEWVEIDHNHHDNDSFALDNGDSGVSSVYGSFLDCEAEGLCVTRHIHVHHNRINGGNLLLYSTDATGEDATRHITFEHNEIEQGVIKFRGADDFTICNNIVRVEIDSAITINVGGIIVSETSAPGGRAGTNRRGKVTGNHVYVSGDHTTRRGIYILALTDGEVSDNYVTGAVRGMHIAGVVDVMVAKNRCGVGNTYGLWIDNLFTVRVDTSTSQASDRLTLKENQWGRMRVLLNTDAEVSSVNDEARNDATEAVNVSVTGTSPIVKFKGLKVRYTGDSGSAVIHSATSATAQVIYSGLEVNSGANGFTSSSGSQAGTLRDSEITAATTPVVQPAGSSGDFLEIVGNRFRCTGTPTNAVNQSGTSGTLRLAGNVLLSAFTAPYRLRNTGNDVRDQYMESATDPASSGWANTQTWPAGARIKNSATAAAGVPGWVCTAAGTPGTWNAEASVAS